MKIANRSATIFWFAHFINKRFYWEIYDTQCLAGDVSRDLTKENETTLLKNDNIRGDEASNSR